MSEKLHVAIDVTATPKQLTGAGYYVEEILAELNVRADVSLSLVTRKDDGERFEKIANNAKIIDIAPMSKAGRISFQTLKLGSIVDSLGVDVFHGPHYQLPLKINTPCVVTIHDMTLLTHKSVHTFTKRKFFSKVIPHSAKQARSIICVSQHTKNDVERLIAKHGEIFVAPLGINFERFNPKKLSDEKDILEKRGISGEYIAFLGSFEPRKSIPTLVDAFSKIADQFPNIRLVLAGGQGWGGQEIRTAIVESGVSTRIVTPGRLTHEEIAPFLRNAKLFVYPSLYEGFGMPVAEAMACGTPTITSDSSSMREVAGKGAMLFTPLDSNGLAELMKSLLTHKTLYKQMSTKAISRANDFSWEKCVDQHITAYRFAGSVAGSYPVAG